MPPKAKFTREDIVRAALDIIRERNAESITAQAIAEKLGTSTRPMFNYFRTLGELRAAAAEQARALYNSYAERGLAMTPAFKGFAMEYIRFAMDEPSLFRLLFMRKASAESVATFLDREGHLEKILDAVTETFRITRAEAMWLYESMWIYAHGMAALCASEVMRFTEAEISERLGVLCRAMLSALHMPEDARTRIVPKPGQEMPGSIEDYIAPPQAE